MRDNYPNKPSTKCSAYLLVVTPQQSGDESECKHEA